MRGIPVRLDRAHAHAASKRRCARWAPTDTAAASLLFVALLGVWVVGCRVAIVVAVRVLTDRRRGSSMSFFSTACWRSAICCIMSGAIERALARGDLAARAPRSARWSAATPIAWTPAACRRAAVESLSENLTDGFVSPLFWYVVAGTAGLVVFKVVSTMDSMVGYKTPRYLRFGWCGARLDDVMNFVPARITAA